MLSYEITYTSIKETDKGKRVRERTMEIAMPVFSIILFILAWKLKPHIIVPQHIRDNNFHDISLYTIHLLCTLIVYGIPSLLILSAIVWLFAVGKMGRDYDNF